MRSIHLDIDDDVYARLQTAMGVRAMTGSAHGILDEFVALVLKSIDAGLTSKHIQQAKEQSSPPEYETREEAAYVSRNIDPQGRVVRTERGTYKVVPR